MKYSLHPKDLAVWKGRITEALVKSYISKEVIPKLKKEGWDDVMLTEAWFSPEKPQSDVPQHLRLEWKFEEKFLIANGWFPAPKFLKRLQLLTKKCLENVPDGFLFKIKKAGKKPLNDALLQLDLESWESWTILEEYWFNRSEHEDNEQLDTVDGEIEIIEVKSGRSNIPPQQKRSYGNALREGFVIRFFQVSIVSFERNEFDIEEKLITNPRQLRNFLARKRN